MKVKVTRKFYDLWLHKYLFPDEILDIEIKHFAKYQKYFTKVETTDKKADDQISGKPKKGKKE